MYSVIIPSIGRINFLNELLESVYNQSLQPNEIIILFSHQIFWENMTEQKPKKNGPDLLENELNQNMLDWLNFEGKKLIIISGDYGLNSDEIFCEVNVNKNVLFVASGIYENDNDKMIRLNSFDSGFYLEEVRLP